MALLSWLLGAVRVIADAVVSGLATGLSLVVQRWVTA